MSRQDTFEREARRRHVIGVHIQERGNWRVIFGLLVIGWGLLATAAKNGWDPAYTVLAHWYFPGALTGLGLYRFWSADSGVGRSVGLLIAAIGGYWLVCEVYGWRFNIGQWWPLVIVALGVMLIARAWKPGAVVNEATTTPDASAPFSPTSIGGPTVAAAPETATDAGPVSAFAFWSGVHRRVAAGFKRGNLAAVMGGIELDLRPSVAVGGVAVVEVFVLMGGVEITLPPDWTVRNEALVVMGGIDDRNSGTSAAKNTLVLKGLILMGGVEIKT